MRTNDCRRRLRRNGLPRWKGLWLDMFSSEDNYFFPMVNISQNSVVQFKAHHSDLNYSDDAFTFCLITFLIQWETPIEDLNCPGNVQRCLHNWLKFYSGWMDNRCWIGLARYHHIVSTPAANINPNRMTFGGLPIHGWWFEAVDRICACLFPL